MKLRILSGETVLDSIKTCQKKSNSCLVFFKDLVTWLVYSKNYSENRGRRMLLLLLLLLLLSPSSPMVMLTAVPPGWNRRVVVEQGRPVAKYFSPIGKRFSCYEEVAAFFQRQNYSVPRHLFTFSVEEDLEGESSEESDLADFDSEPEDCESNCPSNAKRRRRVSSLWEEEVGEMVASCPPWSPPPSSGAQIPVSSPNIASPSVTEVHH